MLYKRIRTKHDLLISLLQKKKKKNRSANMQCTLITVPVSRTISLHDPTQSRNPCALHIYANTLTLLMEGFSQLTDKSPRKADAAATTLLHHGYGVFLHHAYHFWNYTFWNWFHHTIFCHMVWGNCMIVFCSIHTVQSDLLIKNCLKIKINKNSMGLNQRYAVGLGQHGNPLKSCNRFLTVMQVGHNLKLNQTGNIL